MPYSMVERNGKIIGESKTFENFTFMKVYESGHMAPLDKP